MMKTNLFLSLLGVAFIGPLGMGNAPYQTVEQRDTRIVIQVDGDVKDLNANQIKARQNAVINEIRTNVTKNFWVEQTYTGVVNAIAISVNAKNVSEIEKLSGVRSVDFNVMHSVQTFGDGYVAPKENKDLLDENISAKTMNVPETATKGAGVLVAVLDTGAMINHEEFTDLSSGVVKKYTQETLLPVINGSGFHGKPDATHSTYFNTKVPFFYDYGGDTSERNAVGAPDYDVSQTVSEHGGHVASIIGGNGDTYKGIAPNCQIAVMKVFTTYLPNKADSDAGYTAKVGAYDVPILNALEDSYKMGVDIVNMSLGSDLNDFKEDSAVITAIENLKELGCNVNVAAGNSGKGTFELSGEYANWATGMVETGILSSYANSDAATVVAATTADREFYEAALLLGGKTVSYNDQVKNYTSSDGEVKYEPERSLTDIITSEVTTFPYVKIPGWGEVKDYSGLAVSGKIAVIDRGETTFVSKVDAAVGAGAIAALIINNDPSETTFTFRMDFGDGYSPKIPVATILYRDKDAFDNAEVKEVSILSNVIANNPNARQISSFSSDGATYDYRIKPDIAAPGTNIKGAVGHDSTGAESPLAYEYWSGTSMATPNLCGVMAVLLGEHLGDVSYAKTLAMKTMSTAKPMKASTLSDAPYTSPRRQGAGLVDAGAALDSDIYLEGKDIAGSKGIGSSKIELYNGEDISKGVIKLSFLAHNAGALASYNAKVMVYAPNAVELDAEKYPELAGFKFQSIDDQLITTLDQQIDIASGESTIDLNTITLTENQKALLTPFENGCALEGYVFLTPQAEGEEALSIPFLGFYGDYESGEPVEPFTFERDNSKVYQSDLINAVCDNAGFKSADYASMMVTTHTADLETFSIEPVLYNKKSLKDVGTLVGYNSFTETLSKDDLYVGNNGVSDLLLIQQCVLRSVSTNTIKFINKANNQVVLIDHMFDTFFGDEGYYALYKSHVLSDYYSNGIMAHRAYSIISLAPFLDGEYEMEFTYDLVAGGTYKKSYTLHIDSSAPQISKVEEITINSVVYIRVRFDEEYLTYVTISGAKTAVSLDDIGYYVDIVKADYQDAGQILIKAYDLAGATSLSMVPVGAEASSGVSVQSNELLLSYKMTVTVTKDVANDKSNIYQINFTKKGNPVTFLSPVEVMVTLPEGWSNEDLSLFTIDAAGVETEVTNFIVDGDQVTFATSTFKFRLTDNKKEVNPEDSTSTSTPDSTSTDGNNNVVLVTTLSIVGGAIGIAGVVAVVYFLLKKSKAKK